MPLIIIIIIIIIITLLAYVYYRASVSLQNRHLPPCRQQVLQVGGVA